MNKLFAALKKLLFGFGKIILALVVVLALPIGYGVYAEKSASQRATSMCASISPGDETTGLRERAISNGANESQSR